MLTIVEINKDNLELAVSIQNQIFPNENGRDELEATVKYGYGGRMRFLKYWIAYLNGEPVGICGITEYFDYPDDCFLGWYGVLDKFRRQGLGRKMFNFCKAEAENLGYKTLRLYTDEIDNKIAVITYKKYGMFEEVYNNKNDKTIVVGRTLIFSLPLNGNELIKWNDRMIYLAEEDEAEAKYRK